MVGGHVTVTRMMCDECGVGIGKGNAVERGVVFAEVGLVYHFRNTTPLV